MITLRLWGALLNPPRDHPLYHHITRASPSAHTPRLGVWIELVYLMSCCGLAFLWPLALPWLPLLVMSTLLLGNTLYSMTWAVSISQVIAREREQRTYDLLCLSPSGPLLVNWALCTGCVHRNRVFLWVYFGVRLIVTVLLVTLVIALPLALLSLSGRTVQQADLDLLHTGVFALALTIVFFSDHVCSFVLAGLVGILASNDLRSSAEARLRVMAGFLALQLLSYAGAVVGCLLILPLLYLLSNRLGWFAPLSLIPAGVVVFVIVREFVIRRYWRALLRGLNAEAHELDYGKGQQPV